MNAFFVTLLSMVYMIHILGDSSAEVTATLLLPVENQVIVTQSKYANLTVLFQLKNTNWTLPDKTYYLVLDSVRREVTFAAGPAWTQAAIGWHQFSIERVTNDVCDGLRTDDISRECSSGSEVTEVLASVNFRVVRERIISFHLGHDASIAVIFDGHVEAVLELERLHDERYFIVSAMSVLLHQQISRAVEIVTERTNTQNIVFDVGVLARWGGDDWKLSLLATMINARRWEAVDHHLSHASLGFYDSPFYTALVVSADGQGNDGTFNIYRASRVKGLELIRDMPENLGNAYLFLSAYVPAVTRNAHLKHANYSSFQEWMLRLFFEDEHLPSYQFFLPLPGKLMAYAALGNVREEWIPAMQPWFTKTYDLWNHQRWDDVFPEKPLTEENAKDFAATLQHVFTEHLLSATGKYYQSELEKDATLDGIVLTGGCALNVKANSEVFSSFGPSIHVPSAPNDCGLSVGAAWNVSPPPYDTRNPLVSTVAWSGLPAFDLVDLPAYAKERGARRVTIEDVADVLAAGHIVGVVRGTAEVGPRALGHRSLLCYPDSLEVKTRLNELKGREWYRPVAPIVVRERVNELLIDNEDIDSPHMSFAPTLTPEMAAAFPAIAHLDNTTRVQTVSAHTDEWLHALLLAVGRRRGFPVLTNTSFNRQGKPILNRIDTALALMDEQPQLTYVLAEHYLFARGGGGGEPTSGAGEEAAGVDGGQHCGRGQGDDKREEISDGDDIEDSY